MKFSILIPAYKLAFFKECLDSILVQTYKNFEIVIVNDSSPEDLDSVVLKYSDSRIKYFKNEKNCGVINVVDNWNICLSHATGDYVICIGDDDKLLPNCLEEYSKLLDKYPDIGLLHGWTEIINERSEVVKPTTHRCEFESALSLMWHRMHAYEQQFIGDFCFNREWLLQHGGFYKLPLAWGSDDVSALIGASKNGVANTQIPVFQYRINSQTISNTGDISEKMNAILLTYKWKNDFLSQKLEHQQDELYRKDVLNEIAHAYQKACGQTIAKEFKSKRFWRILYWWSNMKKFNLKIKTLLYAMAQSFK